MSLILDSNYGAQPCFSWGGKLDKNLASKILSAVDLIIQSYGASHNALTVSPTNNVFPILISNVYHYTGESTLFL